MRTTWLILGIMIIAGAIMYFMSVYKSPPGEYDTVKIVDADDMDAKKIAVYAAYEPTEIHFLDSSWMQMDSTPLVKVADGSKLNYMNKRYASVALILSYDNQLFYDLEIDKPDTNQAYEIRFSIQPQNDTFFVSGTINKQQGDKVRFSGPMMKVYKEFLLSYNNRMPPPATDSTGTDTTAITAGPQPGKTITVLRN